MADKFSFFVSYHDAIKGLPDADRLAIYDAMCAYAFEGRDTEFANGLLQVAWTLIRPSIHSSISGQANGSKGGRPKKTPDRTEGVKTPSKTPNETPSDNPMGKGGFEPIGKEGVSDTTETVMDREMEMDRDWKGEGITPSFPLQCIEALNRVLGTTYSEIPGECLRTLERHEAQFSVEDVESMIASKREEWEGTPKTRKWLTPHTLFAPDKFEKYMIQSKQERKEDDSYAYGSDDIQDL